MPWAVGVAVESGVSRATLQRVASWESIHRATGLLAEGRSELAKIGRTSIEDGQELAGSGITLPSSVVLVVALINSILKGGNIPAVLEVSVEGEASRVTSSPNEGPSLGLSPARSKVLNVPGDLVEEFHHINGVIRRAGSVIEPRHESSVALVIGRVEILAVPASRHVDASLEASLACRVRESGSGRSTVISGLSRSVVSETSPLDRTFCKFVLSTGVYREFSRATSGASTEHLKASREGLKTGSAV